MLNIPSITYNFNEEYFCIYHTQMSFWSKLTSVHPNYLGLFLSTIKCWFSWNTGSYLEYNAGYFTKAPAVRRVRSRSRSRMLGVHEVAEVLRCAGRALRSWGPCGEGLRDSLLTAAGRSWVLAVRSAWEWGGEGPNHRGWEASGAEKVPGRAGTWDECWRASGS